MSAGEITACIVARDEQAALGGCLASVQGVVDAVVVVDHGSQDRTAAIAERAGARVIEAPGGHHERARNIYLDAVTTPWVLVIDADERLSERARHALRELTRSAPPAVLGFGLERFEWVGRGRWASSRLVRLFRAHPAIRYFDSRAHASVVPAIEELEGQVVLADAPLHHLDALLPRDHAAKRAFMRERLRAELGSGGLPVMHCFLALELFAEGLDSEATRELHEAIARNPRCEPIARLFLAQQHRMRGRLAEAAEEATHVLALDPDFRGRAGAFVVLADAHDRQGDHESALRVAESALAEGDSAANHLNLAALLADVDLTGARAHFAAAVRVNPWLLRKEVFCEATAACIFLQQDALLARVPRGDLFAAELGHVDEEIADASSSFR